MTGKSLLGITWRWALVMVAMVMFVAPAPAGITVGSWGELFLGIDHATGYADGQGGDPLQKVNCLRIDLSANLEFYVTPQSGSNETTTQKTGDFLTENNLQVAINSHFFDPFNPSGFSYETGLLGAVVSRGNVVSPSQSGYEELLISQNNTAWFDTTPSNSFTGVWTAVAGNTMLLVNGVAQHAAGGAAHPRTAVGISEDDRYLYMMAIDGRQTGVSEGSTHRQTADWLGRFGAHDGLNLDGGGSTTMAKDDGQGGYDLLNVPVGGRTGAPGSKRWNGSNIGVHVVPEPAAIALLLSGIGCLAVLAVRRNVRGG